MDTIILQQKLDKIFDLIGEIQRDITEVKITMAENTIIVKQHEQRSTTSEKWLSKIQAAIVILEKEQLILKGEIKALTVEKEAVNDRTKKSENTLNIFRSIPEILKFVALLVGTLSAIYGLITVIEKLVNK